MNELKPCPFCGGEAVATYNTQFGFQVFCGNDECFMNFITMYDMATEEEAIEAWNRRVNKGLPTIDVVKRKRGKWIITDIYNNRIWHCNCSECGEDPQHFISGTEDWWINELPNFCPNCGCAMEGKYD